MTDCNIIPATLSKRPQNLFWNALYAFPYEADDYVSRLKADAAS
jgi:hypothetical protein